MGGFKDFLFRGNLVQLAVAVIIGASFANLVTAFTSGLITPLLGIFGGQPSFKNESFTINGSEFRYGAVVDACITFLITAFVLYYIVVVPATWVMDKFKKVEESTQTSCAYCCSKVDKKATKCAFCTSDLEPVPDEPVEVVTTESEAANGEVKGKKADKNHVTPEEV